MMKTQKSRNILMMVVLAMILAPAQLFAQQIKGNKKVVKEERTIQPFTALEVGGAFDVSYAQGATLSLVVEADDNLMKSIRTEVKDGRLTISSKNIRNATSLNIYLTAPALNEIKLSGAANLEGENTLTTQDLLIDVSGASEARLMIEVETLKANASGASELKLRGTADDISITASGASEVKASELLATTGDANASGAADIKINVSEKISTSSSGAGNVTVRGNADVSTHSRNIDYDFEGTNVESWQDGDKTSVKIGGIVVEVTDGDSTKVAIGNHSLVVDEDGNVEFKRNRVQKFKGHWAGFDMGINGYVDKDFKTNLPPEYGFLDLKYEKSIDVNINFFEQNINLAGQKFGLVTGLGLRWNNYRFANNVVLEADSMPIYGYQDISRDWRKSKLVVNYLTLPLLLEFQTNRFSRTNSFHISAGAILGWRFASHSKNLYFDNGRQKPKQHDSFNLRPFRYDATVRIGWGIINLYATYALNTMFKDGGGPELYPFAIGITFLNL
jgi:hypothetical protein